MVTEVAVGLDVSLLLSVLESGDVLARQKLASQLADMLVDPETNELEREQVVPVVLKLAADADPEIRLLLNERFVSLETLHPDILFALIADEDVLALPFLAATPALTAQHMFAILRVGDESRQCVIASRADITKPAAQYAKANAGAAVVIALLKNPSVIFSNDELRTIYTKFPSEPSVQDVITQREDCPNDLLVTHTKRTASRLRQLMAERGWTGAGDSHEFVADAEESTVLSIIANADDIVMTQTLVFLVGKNLLTPSLIVRAACVGELRVVEAVLSHLSGYSAERTRDLMFGRGGSGLKTLVHKAGIPNNCLGVLTAACDTLKEASSDGIQLTAEAFGRRVLEALMTRYEFLSPTERSKQIEFTSRYAHERVRKIAKRLRSDMLRAA